jgi:murein DD-endopeptidase MepM/ murein hydrolase activator NlpD
MPFGAPLPELRQAHTGVDFIGRGDSIVAISDGVVEYVIRTSKGMSVGIRHPRIGRVVQYSHLIIDDRDIRANQTVSRGQYLGEYWRPNGHWHPHVHIDVCDGDCLLGRFEDITKLDLKCEYEALPDSVIYPAPCE